MFVAAAIEHVPLEEFYTDASAMERTVRTVVGMFDVSVACLPFDDSLEAAALGAEVEFVDGVPTVTAGCVADADGAFDLPVFEVGERGRVPVCVDAVSRLVQNLPERSVVAGVTGPGTLADQVIMDPDPPAEVEAETLLSAGEAGTELARDYLDAGADAVAVVERDPPATLPDEYREAVEPVVNLVDHYERRLLFVTDRLPATLLPDLADLGFDAAAGTPAATDAHAAETDTELAVGYGLPGAAFLGGPDAIEEHLAAASGYDFVTSALQVPRETPVESLHALMDAG